MIADNSSKEISDKVKKEINQYKTESASIEIEGQTPILGLSKSNWNFLYEGVDFKISLLGKIELRKND